MSHKITAKVDANRMSLAKWARSLRCRPINSLPLALAFADDLLRGGQFELYLTAAEKAAGEAWCNIEKVVYVDPYAADRAEQARYYELRDKGAAGDAEAAIAYCKLELEGKVSHGAMA